MINDLSSIRTTRRRREARAMATARKSFVGVVTTSLLLVAALVLSNSAVVHGLSLASLTDTPAIRAYTKTYLDKHYKGNAVQAGGWYAAHQSALLELGRQKLEQSYRPNLPDWFNVVQDAGGWHALTLLAADPKGSLSKLLQAELKQTQGLSGKYVSALVALLHAQGKGFENGPLVDGPWTLVWQQQGNNSPKIQKLVSQFEKSKTITTKDDADATKIIATSDSTFDVDAFQFYGTVTGLRGQAVLSSAVKYNPVPHGFSVILTPTTSASKATKKIVLRRIACEIVDTSIKVWKLPKLPLPLKRLSRSKGKGGYLDFSYLDHDLRITRGSRGGMFIHARPAFVKSLILSK